LTRLVLRLQGPGATGTRVHGRLLRSALDVLVDTVEQSVRLRAEGRSQARGSKPSWLERASAFTVAIRPGSTVLDLEAPPLAQLVPDRFAQTEMFEPIEPDQSCLDVFAGALRSALEGERDSDLFDDTLIGTLLGLGDLFEHGVQSVEVENGARLHVDRSNLEKLRELRRAMPPDQRVRVAGTLDALRHSSRTFELRLEDGEVVRGILAGEAGEIAEFGSQLGSQVLVEGTAKFRASGRVLRIDADSLASTEATAGLWTGAPRPVFSPLGRAELRYPQGPRSGLAAIIGQWPGDETDEEIEVALRDLS
jgi:hypothetical protein